MVVRAFDIHTNFAYSTVLTAPSPASSGTSLVLAAGEGARFPDPATYGPYNIVIWPAGSLPTSSNAEVVRVTALSTDTLTITRTQESSSARTVIVGDSVAQAATAKTFTDIEGGQATVATTDATVTTLATIACPDGTTTMIEARVVARRTGGASGTAEDGAAYVVTAAFKATGSVATIIGAADQDVVIESQAGWECTIDASGATARIRVTGAANNNVTWLTSYRILQVSS